MYTFPIVVDPEKSAEDMLAKAVNYRLPGLEYSLEPKGVLNIYALGFFQLPKGWEDTVESGPDRGRLYLVTTESHTGKPYTTELVSDIFHAGFLAERSDFSSHRGLGKECPEIVLDVSEADTIPSGVLISGAKETCPGVAVSIDTFMDDRSELVINNIGYSLYNHWENEIKMAQEDPRIDKAWAFCSHNDPLMMRFCDIVLCPADFASLRRNKM